MNTAGVGDAPADGRADPFFEGSAALRVLHHLEHAVTQDDRLIVLTGDDGVGKSTVVQRLLRGLDHRNKVWCVLLQATHLETGELSGSLARAFGAPGHTPFATELYDGLRRHLAALGRGRTVLAVVDDAHALPPEALADLGDLLRDGPLRVLLVGRPALRSVLEQQLPAAHASLECHLDPLPDSETPAYVDHRLRRLAPNGAPEFTDDAKALIHRLTGGVPLRIDRLCERLLRSARQRGLRRVDGQEVQRVARPRADDASVPMLTSTVEEASSGWAAPTVPGDVRAPHDSAGAPPPAPVVPPRRTRKAAAMARRGRAALVGAALLGVSVLAIWAWRYYAPLRVDSSMTVTAPPAPTPTPAPVPTPTPAPAPAATTPPAPLPTRPAPPSPPPPATANTPAPTPPAAGTPVAAPPAVPTPCPANVVALGLCPDDRKP